MWTRFLPCFRSTIRVVCLSLFPHATCPCVFDLITILPLLQASVGLGELGTWRHQRQALGVLVYSAVSLFSALPAATAVHPVLTV